ncbi:MAG: reprolysin-like metallopeptidase, partial [Planctomycetota bacterium]
MSQHNGEKRARKLGFGFESLEERRVLSADVSGIAEVYWQSQETIPASTTGATSYLNLAAYESFTIDVNHLESSLESAPMERTPDASHPLVFAIPRPDGDVEHFAVVESPVMAEGLAERFPEINTYFGVSLDNAGSTVRFDLTPQGFHAQVRTIDGQGGYYVDPFYHLENEHHVSYFRSDAIQSESDRNWSDVVYDTDGNVIGDHVHTHADGTVHTHSHTDTAGYHVHADGTVHSNADHVHGQIDSRSDADLSGDSAGDRTLDNLNSGGSGDEGSIQLIPRTGTDLRTYRLAVATTGEYTSFHGGTVNSALAAVVTSVNRITGVYEDEFTIRMELVDNNDSVIFTNAATDPFSGNPGLGSIHSAISSRVGNANFDVGHLFDTGNGGYAGLGVVGNNSRKGWGYTGLTPPMNDPFDIDYAAHELGHQFGANHTFNGCGGGGGAPTSQYEPGSGSTIMGYAGICGSENLQNNSDPYFHSRSLDEIVAFVNARPGVGTWTDTNNTIPTADAGMNYTIPTEVAFTLTGSGTDADGDILTYTWEQRDLGPSQGLNAADNGRSPLFRSIQGTTNPSRTLPQMRDVLDGTLVRGEKYPTRARVMDFRLTVRDFNPDGGGVATDDMIVNVVDTNGTFEVLSPSASSDYWETGDTEVVTWNVAGTTGSGINTSHVDILLSTNGGTTFEMLAENTPNDGSESVMVPNVTTTQARVLIRAVDNIYFDVSDRNFEIGGPVDDEGPTATATASNITTEGGSNNAIVVTYMDDAGVDSSTIGSSDVEVVDPNGNTIPTFLISFPPPSAQTVVATYTMAAPGGGWDASDNGTYEIRTVAGNVEDLLGNGTDASVVGSFEVNIGGTMVDGDFDDDGDLDCADIDALTMAVAGGSTDLAFDLTGDGVVNFDDVDDWVINEKGTLHGDANLDMNVDVGDFAIWNANKFTFGTGWCSGD